MRDSRTFNTQHDGLVNSPDWSPCEELIESFESAWRRGARPEIPAFVRGEGPLRRALLVELVHADLEFRLKSGEAVRVESYLSAYPELADDQQTAIDLIAAEYELRRRKSPVSIAEYHDRFPAHIGKLALGATLSDSETLYPPPPSTLAPGDGAARPEVAGFEIVAEIGRGGMGVVYQARELTLDRQVALKFLPAEFMRDAERLERFEREARTASGLNHPQICTIHALGEQDGRPYIVMEYIEGRTLKAIIPDRPTVEESLRIVSQAARALAAAHAAGVVHRDIKPENIMLRPDGYVKVLDFGLARRLPTLLENDLSDTGDTQPGAMLGTVAYMSPEQARGAAAESASDVFSLGIVFYQLLTGRHPFESGSALGMLTAITTRHSIAPSKLNAEVSRLLDGIVEGMLHKDPRLRPTAAALEEALAKARIARAGWSPAARRVRNIVHREAELSAFRTALAAAEAGQGSILCVAGEPGIGKTTLVEDFLDELATSDRAYVIARGQCSERLAETEAYLPVIDALQDLLRADTTGAVARLMTVVAPTWYSIVAPDAAEVGSLSGRSARAPSQQAMLREFRSMLEEATRHNPVVLFLDDVHWADVSTVDLLAHLGRHCGSLPVLTVVTFRPTELILLPHPFYRVKLELQSKGVCSELPLGFLTVEQIDRFLSLVFPGHGLPADFAEVIYRRTEGSPLFIADLVAYLRERGVIAQLDGRWSLAQDLPDHEELPESVRSMIQRKLEQLADSDRRLLAAAAVQGHEFDSAVVARALSLDPAEVEERLQALDRVHSLVRLLRDREFPGGALSLRYAFVHALYQQALYNDLPPSRRAKWALALAQARESLDRDLHSAAAELACLYEVGRDYQSAARQYWHATQNAARVFAHHEAISLAERGLRLLDALPDAERLELEIALQTALGLQLQLTQGYAAPAAERAYTRARELCLRSADPSREFPVLWGLWLCHKVRSELAQAQEVANELFGLARRVNEPGLALQAHQALGMTAFCRGDQTATLQNVELVAAMYDPDRHFLHAAVFGQDPGVMCKSYGAVALWLMGYPDTARLQCEHALEMSQGLSPTTQAVAPHFAAMVSQLCGNRERTAEYAQRAITISTEHGLSFWLAGGTVLAGWALAAEGRHDEGLAMLRQGLADWRATGSVTYETYYLGLLAEVLTSARQFDEALEVLDEAIALVEHTGERFYEAELYRLRGEVLLLGIGATGDTVLERARDDFHRSLEIAQRQAARSLELRTAMSLVDLTRRGGLAQDELGRLCAVYETFAEGFSTDGLKAAEAMLKSKAR